MRCVICGDVVRVGHAVHNSCFEHLLPVWHSPDERPATHIETAMIAACVVIDCLCGEDAE